MQKNFPSKLLETCEFYFKDAYQRCNWPTYRQCMLYNIYICLLRYLMEQLRKLCEAALVSGVRVTRENLFDLARWWSWWSSMCRWSWWWLLRRRWWLRGWTRLAGEFSCLQPAAGTLLTKCSKFLRFWFFSWTCLFHRLLLMTMCQYLRQQCFCSVLKSSLPLLAQSKMFVPFFLFVFVSF